MEKVGSDEEVCEIFSETTPVKKEEEKPTTLFIKNPREAIKSYKELMKRFKDRIAK